MRSNPEWVAKGDDAAIPPRVRLRIFMQHNGDCAKCGRRLVPGHWSCDHIVALVNGGKHREKNLHALCNSPCHSDKTRADVAEKSKVNLAAAKNVGIRPPSRIRSAGFRKAKPQRSASRPLEKKVNERTEQGT